MISNVDETFARASLCYLTHRYDEGFQLIRSTSWTPDRCLDSEQQQVFCLISLGVIEERRRSFIRLNHLLVQSGDPPLRQAIQIYMKSILTELAFFSEEIISMIDAILLRCGISIDSRLFYLKLKGDVHFVISETSTDEMKREHLLSALSLYDEALEGGSNLPLNRILLSIIFNKALLFVLVMEESNIARDLLKDTLKKVQETLSDEDRSVCQKEVQRLTDLLQSLEHRL